MKKIKIFVLKTQKNSEKIKKIAKMLKKSQINRLNKITNSAEYSRRLCGFYLINKHLYGSEIKIDNNGKPYTSDLFFNISHSGDYAVFVANDKVIGIDIQKIREVKTSLINHTMSESEKSKIKNSEDFILAWTQKESLLKCVGTGIITDVKSVPALCGENIEYNGQQFITQSMKFEDYIISITYQGDKKEIELIEEYV